MKKEILCWNKNHPNVLEHWNALVDGKYIFSTKEAQDIDKDMVISKTYYVYHKWEKVAEEHLKLKKEAFLPWYFVILW